jgi:carboxypeptidase family protein
VSFIEPRSCRAPALIPILSILATFSIGWADEPVSKKDEPGLVRVTGFVFDDAGHPIPGASLSHFDSVASPVHPLNENGNRSADPNAAAETSANGRFELFALKDRNATFLVEATGFAPALAAADQFAKGGERLVLRRGASLTVRWTTLAKPHSERVSLIPVDVELPQGMSRERAIRIWTRNIVTGQEHWGSLPVGTYQVVLRANDIMTNGKTPVELAEVVLAPGDDQSISVELPPIRSPIESSRKVSVPIHIEASDPDMFADMAVTEWRDGIPTLLAATSKRDGTGIVITAPMDCRAGSSLVIESPKAIGVAVPDGTCSEPVTLRLEPRASIAARFSVPRGVSAPRSGIVRFTKCGRESSSFEIPFATSDGGVHVGVPAGCGEMSVRTTGFAPIHPAKQELSVGTSHDLGVLSLRPGAAAVLRVRSGRNAELMEGVRITAIRASALSAMKRAIDVESLALGASVTDAAGWARLTGLPADRLVFLLQARNRKYPQVSDEYELAVGDETVLDDLVVEPAANVRVTLSVPPRLLDVIDLGAVELLPTGRTRGLGRIPMSAELTPSGAVVEDVPPGAYVVQATGRIRDGFALRVAETKVDVFAGLDQQVPLTLTDSLYSGRVTRGGLAVSGTINLRPADKTTSNRPAVSRLDADGNFHVLLDGPGNYSVSVQTRNHDSIALGKYVEFADSDDSVAIELPVGRMSGRVVDPTGAPVAGAGVTAKLQVAEPVAEVSSVNTKEGRFTLEGVTPGTWEVYAESKNERSEPTMVSVDDDDVDGITLVVDPTDPVTVRVVGPGGEPLRDVVVQTEFPRIGREPKSYFGRTRDNGEVKFRLVHSEQSQPTNLVVATSDGRLSCETRTLNSDQTIAITSYTGEVHMAMSPSFTKQGSRNWLISPTGCAVPFIVRPQTDGTGAEVRVFRGLVPGEWTYVQAHSSEEIAAVLTGRGSSLASIRTFVVEAGRTTRITSVDH